MKAKHEILGALLGAAVLASAMPASADGRIHVIPVDGAHWEPGAGLPDGNGNANQALVQDVTQAFHTEVGQLKGLAGAPGTALTGLRVAALTPSGIDPCWKVGITAADGSVTVLHLTLDSARNEGSVPTSTGDSAPYRVWVWTFTIPADSTINYVSLQVDAGQSPPPTNDRVAFDGFSVNGSSIATP